MKALIIFALIATLTFADYTPKWDSCSQPDDPWQPTTITLDKEPKLNEYNTMHACGTVQDVVTVGSFKLKVIAGSTTIFTTEVALPKQDVFPGSQYCFDYKVFIPIIARGSFSLNFNLRDDTAESIGCFHIDLTLKNPQLAQEYAF